MHVKVNAVLPVPSCFRKILSCHVLANLVEEQDNKLVIKAAAKILKVNTFFGLNRTEHRN